MGLKPMRGEEVSIRVGEGFHLAARGRVHGICRKGQGGVGCGCGWGGG